MVAEMDFAIEPWELLTRPAAGLFMNPKQRNGDKAILNSFLLNFFVPIPLSFLEWFVCVTPVHVESTELRPVATATRGDADPTPAVVLQAKQLPQVERCD